MRMENSSVNGGSRVVPSGLCSISMGIYPGLTSLRQAQGRLGAII